jgi:hypothetical protein
VADCETNYRLLVGLLPFCQHADLACDFCVGIMRRETRVKNRRCDWCLLFVFGCVIVFGIGTEVSDDRALHDSVAHKCSL